MCICNNVCVYWRKEMSAGKYQILVQISRNYTTMLIDSVECLYCF